MKTFAAHLTQEKVDEIAAIVDPAERTQRSQALMATLKTA
jgi:hypothetical protein